MEIKIVRLEKTKDGVIGIMLIGNKVFCSTLEHPELLINFGVYKARLSPSPRFRRSLYELYDTPHRTEILIHVGNTKEDTSGCILLGKYVDDMNGKRAVWNSGDTIDRFHQITQGEVLKILIYDLI